MLISTIKELAKYVKINVQIPFETLQPYIQLAEQKYILPYTGVELYKRLEALVETPESATEKETQLLQALRQSLAPFAVLEATPETSINFGDAGHTVTKTDHYVPASDSKIQAYQQSLKDRAWFGLEITIRFLEANTDIFPEWEQSEAYTHRKGRFFSSAKEFQEKGLVEIQYSRLTFEKMRMILASIEETELKPLLGNALFEKASNPTTDTEMLLKSYCQRFLAHRAACVETSKKNIQPNEFIPLIKPLAITDENNNFYCQKATEFLTLLNIFINNNQQQLDIQAANTALNYNKKERHIFLIDG